MFLFKWNVVLHRSQGLILTLASYLMTLRSVETEVSESKTNIIDRAVASLMFNKFDYEDNDHQTDYDYEDDAEVPMGGMRELVQPTVY